MKKLLKRILIIIFVLFLFGCATVSVVKDQKWENFNDVQYGDDFLQYLDISLPKDRTGRINAIMFIHGFNGGMMDYWTLLDNNYRDSFVVGVMNYRNLAQNGVTIKDIIEDVDNAIIAMKKIAQENGIQINKLIIMGHSLGGSMTLYYGYNYLNKEPAIPIAFIMNFAGFTDLSDPTFINLYKNNIPPWNQFPMLLSNAANILVSDEDMNDFGFNNRLKESLKKISPVNYVNNRIPPTIIVHDTNDETNSFSQALILRIALDNVGVPHILVPTTNNLGHMFNFEYKYIGKKENLAKLEVIHGKEIEAKIVDIMNTYINLYGY